MRTRAMNDSRRGSITIEAAIALAVTICFITSVVTAISLIRTDILMQRAVSNTCEDFALLMPLSVTAADAVSTFTNALPEDVSLGQDATGTMTTVVTRLAGFDVASDRALTEAVFDALLSSEFEDDIAERYVEYNSGSEFFLPSSIDVDFEIDAITGFIAVNVTYQVDTIAGTVTMHVTDGIPFYGDLELFLNGNDTFGEEGNDEDVWHMSNIDRGIWFEEHYGTNLPHTFPVINDFDGGQATSYVSIDLNRPTYEDPSRIQGKIEEQIDELAGFDGADVTINGTSYNIDGSSIDSRRLVVVIPSNSPEASVDTISSLQGYAEANGVELIVDTYGNS